MSTASWRRFAEKVFGALPVRRRLPAASGGGSLFATARVGGLKYLLKPSSRLDPELLRIASVLVKANNVVWDVGANVGLFSLAAAHHAGTRGRVFSIEADIDAVALLNRTCRREMPGHAVITVLPVAVSKEVGFVRFSIAQRARAANAIEGFGKSQTGGVREIRTLPCVTLDHLLEEFPPPDVLKIDVEGAELNVLLGARRLLTEIRPALYCEVSSELRAEITRLLSELGYRLWDGSEFHDMQSSAGVISTNNMVALPMERFE